ncbi:MAG: hypothetical protein ACRDG4_02950, partial [Chloroflexota bacterium]
LYVESKTAMSLVGTTLVITLYDATTSTPTSLTCAFSGVEAIGATCTDPGDQAVIPVGDEVAYQVSEMGLGSAAGPQLLISSEAN